MKWFVLIFLFVLLTGSFYLFRRGWSLLPRRWPIRIGYSLLFIVLVFSYPIGMMGKETIPIVLVKWLSHIGGIFMLSLLYLVLALLVIDLARILNHFFRFFPSFLTKDARFTGRITAGILLLSLTVLLGIGHYRFSHPETEELELRVDKEAKGRKELHIVAVSDIHLGFTIGKQHLKKYVRQINSLQPDLIVISGDLIDMSVRPLEAYAMYEELRELQAPLGVYMVTGNHEYISGIEASRSFIRKTGIRLLENEWVSPDSTFVLVGQNDPSDPGSLPFGAILADAPENLPVIALSHQPRDLHLQDAIDSRVDFLFCGHTHEGQIWPGNQLVKKLFKIPYGYEQKEQTHIFVSSGLGLWGPQFRIGTQSEVVSVKLTFQ